MREETVSGRHIHYMLPIFYSNKIGTEISSNPILILAMFQSRELKPTQEETIWRYNY